MSEADLVARLRAINGRAEFNLWLGLEVVAAAPGRVELGLPWRPDLGQYAGFLHAGVAGALIDTACGFAAVTQTPSVLASQYQVSFYAPAVGDAFRVQGRVEKAGKRQVFAAADLFAVKAGVEKRVAAGTAVLLVT